MTPRAVLLQTSHGPHSGSQMALCTNGTLLSTGEYSERRGRAGSAYRFLPVRYNFPSGIRTIAVGAGHTILITNDGSVWTFGNNYNGQLGRPSPPRGLLTAEKVQGIPERAARVAAGEGGCRPRWLWGRGNLWSPAVTSFRSRPPTAGAMALVELDCDEHWQSLLMERRGVRACMQATALSSPSPGTCTPSGHRRTGSCVGGAPALAPSYARG